MRLAAWNIRAGGGVRAEKIVKQVIDWQPDIVVLSEFRDTEASRSIAEALAHFGLIYQKTTANPKNAAVNALLVASFWPIRRQTLRRAPDNPSCRWLHVNVYTPKPLAIIAVHIPNRASGLKYPYLQAITEVVQYWRGPPAILVGDTNSGCIDIDEESKAFNGIEDRWIKNLETLGWQDAFRFMHGKKLEYTWYSPNGRNGFRLDQAFIHPKLIGCLQQVQHNWGDGERRDELSDHAALLLDFE